MHEGNPNPPRDQPTISFALAVGEAREVCVGADKSGESPGLTGHTPRQVANNVSRKNEGSGHTFVLLCFYSPFYGTTATIRIPYLFFVLSPVFLQLLY